MSDLRKETRLDRLLRVLGVRRDKVKAGLFVRSDDTDILDMIAKLALELGTRVYRVDSFEHDGNWVLHHYRPHGAWDRTSRATSVAVSGE